MSGGASLLETVQRLLERTYRMHSGIDDVARFVVGDAGYRRLYLGRPQVVSRAESSDEFESPRTFVRECSDGVRLCIYYPDSLIRRLERHPPRRGLRDENVDDFATLIEELDHLLLIAERTRAGRPVSFFELELHANVSKHLVLARFAAGRAVRITRQRLAWLEHHLFDKHRYTDDDPAVRERYRDAARWAAKLVRALPRLASPRRRLEQLRRFHDLGHAEKLRLIEGLGRG